MAWPASPLTTYTFDGAPPIKSFDLNQIQDAINQMINGTYTFRALTIDGTGGNTTVPTPGNLTVSGDLVISGSQTIMGSINATLDLNAGRDVNAFRNVIAGQDLTVGRTATIARNVIWGDPTTSDPPITTTMPHQIRDINTPRVWGIINWNSAHTLTSNDGIGYTLSYPSAVYATSPTSAVDIHFVDSMSSATSYNIILAYGVITAATNRFNIHAESIGATGFTVVFEQSDAAVITPVPPNNCKLSFTCFGRQA